MDQYMRRVVNTTTPAIRKMLLDTPQKNLVLAHGTAIRGTFIVPRGTSFVFLSEPGKELSQRVVDKYFYELFSSPRIENIPKDWVSRTYLEGSECPNLFLTPSDTMWPGMGFHRLPLRGFLTVHPIHPNDAIKDPEKLAREIRERNNPQFKNSVERGTPLTLLSTIGPRMGVVFVVACRSGANVVRSKSIETMRKSSRERILRVKRGQHQITGANLPKNEQERLLLEKQRKKIRETLRSRKPMDVDSPSRGTKRKSPELSNVSNVEDLMERLSLDASGTKRQKSIIMGLVLDQRKKRRKLSR